MKYIELSKQGKNKGKYFAIVDDEDYEDLIKHRWQVVERNKNCYVKCVLNGKTIFMHRYIMKCEDDKLIDHINHDGLDNRRFNLRKCNASENKMNQRNLILPFKGITKSSKNTFKAQIQLYGKKIILGSFKTEIEAARAYDEAAKKHFGEFANINFKD